MKILIYSISVVILVFAQSILCQTTKKTTAKELGASWREYQQAVQNAENGDPKNAERFFLAAIETARKSLNKTAEGLIALELGELYQTFRRPHKARNYFELAVAVYRESGDELAEQRSLVKMASAIKTSEYTRGEEIFKKAFIVFDRHKAFYDRAVALRLLSEFQTENVRYEEAGKTALESLVLHQKYGESIDEIMVLRQLGIVEYKQKRYEQSRQYLEQAIAKLKNYPDAQVEAQTLISLGGLEQLSGHPAAATSTLQQALALSEQKKLIPETIDALIIIGMTQIFSGKMNPAQQAFERALQTAKEFEVTEAAATAANALGIIYGSADNIPKAIETLKFAAEKYTEVGNQRLIGPAYYGLAMIYNKLGDAERGEYYRLKALEVQNKFNGIPEKHSRLYGVGQKFFQEKNYAESKKHFTELLESSRKNTDALNEALARQKLGEIALQENEPLAAQSSFLAAQDIYLRLKSDDGLAIVKKGQGDTFTLLKKFDQAQESYGQSLYFYRSSQSIAGEAAVFSGLMKISKAQGKKHSAIFFGKQSVSLLQKLRGSLSSLDVEVQKNFIAATEDVYRTLSMMLIEDERLSEAQQIIELLKEDEYFQYTNRNEKISEAQIPQVALNSDELLAYEKYKKLVGTLDETNRKTAELEQKKTTTGFSVEDQEKMTVLEAERSRLSAALINYLQETKIQLAKPSTSSSLNISGGENWQKKLAAWNDEAVLISTLITENHTYLILTTSTGQTAYRVDIPASELNNKIDDFRDVLEDPRSDVLYYAQYFYKQLLAPIVKDIRRTKARVLLISLDGNLRYVPFAALHDGEKFIVEDFTTVVVTLAQVPDNPNANFSGRRGLGVGVSVSVGDFPPLSNVAMELQTIIREEKNPHDEGFFPGKLLIDADFTRKTFTENLQEKFDFILIASHFELKGKDTDSFLLLGGGEQLDLETFRTAPEFTLRGTELLILSACNTGVSSANGVEFESFAVLAQKRGARSVLATLWKVADKSTAALMTNFFADYQKQDSDYAKARILRDGQLKMLKSENAKGFSHPYYWSPFVLLGKWR